MREIWLHLVNCGEGVFNISVGVILRAWHLLCAEKKSRSSSALIIVHWIKWVSASSLFKILKNRPVRRSWAEWQSASSQTKIYQHLSDLLLTYHRNTPQLWVWIWKMTLIWHVILSRNRQMVLTDKAEQTLLLWGCSYQQQLSVCLNQVERKSSLSHRLFSKWKQWEKTVWGLKCSASLDFLCITAVCDWTRWWRRWHIRPIFTLFFLHHLTKFSEVLLRRLRQTLV